MEVAVILLDEGQSKSKLNIVEVNLMFGITPFRRRPHRLARRSLDLDVFFDNIWNEFETMTLPYSPIKVDIRDEGMEYILEAEIPGAEKDDIILEAKDDILTIAVERKEEVREERENYIRRERRSGSYSRSFYLDDVEQDKIRASFENGILKVVLPKKTVDSSGQYRIPIE